MYQQHFWEVIFLPNSSFFLSFFPLVPFYQLCAHLRRVPALCRSHLTPLHLLVSLQGEGVTILHSHLRVTVDHACHLGGRLVLAPQLFDICSWKSFEAAGPPWESRETVATHTRQLFVFNIWTSGSRAGARGPSGLLCWCRLINSLDCVIAGPHDSNPTVINSTAKPLSQPFGSFRERSSLFIQITWCYWRSSSVA